MAADLTQSTELLGEPTRCVHIGDRESDIYELFCAARESGTHFLVRTCVDRLAGDGGHTIATEMNETAIKGLHRIEVRDDKGNAGAAVLEIKYRRIEVLPPIGKQKRYPRAELDGNSCSRARRAENQKGYRLEADHRFAGAIKQGRCQDARLVCHAMEDRGVPQDPEVRPAKPKNQN